MTNHPVILYIHMSRCCNPEPQVVSTIELDNPATANTDVATALRELANEWEHNISDTMRWQPEP